MKSTRKLAVVAGTLLTVGLAGTLVYAHPDGPAAGSGWFDGIRHHFGGGPGYGMGPGRHMGAGYPMGPGWHMGQGYAMGPGSHMGPGQGMGRGYGMGPGGMHLGPAGAAADRLEGLESALGLTAEQGAAWQGFADSVTKQADNHRAWFDKMHQSQSARTAPEWFAERDAAMKQHQEDRTAVTAALKDLYGVLTPEQRSILDERFAGPAGRYARRGR